MTLLGKLHASPQLLGEPDENSFGAANVAEPIRVFVLHHFTNELRTALAEPGERVVDVVHSEHDAQVAKSVYRGVPVVGDDGWVKESRKFEPAVAIWSDHHGDLDALRLQSCDAASPLSFDDGSPLQFQAELGEKCDRHIEGFDRDAYVVHPLQSHTTPLSFFPVTSALMDRVSRHFRR